MGLACEIRQQVPVGRLAVAAPHLVDVLELLRVLDHRRALTDSLGLMTRNPPPPCAGDVVKLRVIAPGSSSSSTTRGQPRSARRITGMSFWGCLRKPLGWVSTVPAWRSPATPSMPRGWIRRAAVDNRNMRPSYSSSTGRDTTGMGRSAWYSYRYRRRRRYGDNAVNGTPGFRIRAHHGEAHGVGREGLGVEYVELQRHLAISEVTAVKVARS